MRPSPESTSSQSSSIEGAHSSSSQSSRPPPESGYPAPSQETLLEAFESYIDDFESEAEKKLTPSERRKEARARELAEAREAHLRRLEVLSTLPADLVVAPSQNKCPGCGTVLQTNYPDRPGYLPRTASDGKSSKKLSVLDDGDESAEPTQIEVTPTPRETICQRCYRLTHYGKIEPHLRVVTRRSAGRELSSEGHVTGEPAKASAAKELSPAKFRKVLERLRNINAVFIYLVDIFDFNGTFVTSLRDVIGQKNPVMLAVNKTDLLPEDYKASRVEGWIQQECAALGLREVAGIHLISSTKGNGVQTLIADTLRIAKRRRSDIYVIGAANVGKSSFINQLIRVRKRDQMPKEKRAGKSGGKRDQKLDATGAITTSVVPGTTLDVIRIPLGGKVSLFDTPGLMIPHQLTNYLDEKELRAVLPAKNVENVTFRLGEGKALHIGGLARVEIVSGRPFFFTCFFAPTVKIHPGRLEDAGEFARRHVGQLLAPPFSQERYDNLGDWTSKSFTATGMGWKKASVDIVLSGLGWISVTGPGSVRLRVCVPKGVGVFTREPLMPFEAQKGVSRYTGSTAVNRKQVNKARKRSRSADEYD